VPIGRRELRLGLVAVAIGAAIAVLLALVSTPGEDDPEEPGDGFSGRELEVAEAIEAAAATRNTDDCSRLATIAFLEQSERRRGESALSACEFALGEQGLLTEPLTVEDVELGPQSDTAEVLYGAGNPMAGLRAQISVVDGKLDQVVDYVDADRGALERALRNELLAGPVVVSRKAVDCAVAQVAALPDADLEALLLTASLPGLYGPVLRCDRGAAIDSIASGLAGRLSFLPATSIACTRDRLSTAPEPVLVKLAIDVEYTGAARIAFACDQARAVAAYRNQLLAPPYEYPARVADCIARRLTALPPRAVAGILIERGTAQVSERCGLDRE
jgi:hypothetical protein